LLGINAIGTAHLGDIVLEDGEKLSHLGPAVQLVGTMPSEHAGAVPDSGGITSTLIFREPKQCPVQGLMIGHAEPPNRGRKAIEPGPSIRAPSFGAGWVRLPKRLRD